MSEHTSVAVRSGTNTIERRSTESAVTIPYEQTFRNLSDRPTSGTALENYNYCGCGWPQHMLIAKGNAEGFAADLFVMISDGRNDTVRKQIRHQLLIVHSKRCGSTFF